MVAEQEDVIPHFGRGKGDLQVEQKSYHHASHGLDVETLEEDASHVLDDSQINDDERN